MVDTKVLWEADISSNSIILWHGGKLIFGKHGITDEDKEEVKDIARACNAYPKLVDKLIKIHDMILSIHVCDSDATRLSMERFSISDLLKELGETE